MAKFSGDRKFLFHFLPLFFNFIHHLQMIVPVEGHLPRGHTDEMRGYECWVMHELFWNSGLRFASFFGFLQCFPSDAHFLWCEDSVVAAGASE